MSTLTKIQPKHLSLQAVIYIRQSTQKQIIENAESTRRQYQLASKAHQLGWPQSLIKVIDDDLGLSGVNSTKRLGFQRLVAAISLGEIGIVLVTEISRLSRLNSDWHRVIELCSVFETLIADEDGIYNPCDPNDRLLLGLKGTLFAAELHILQARMRGNLINKAKRGELALRLPVGYRRQFDGTVALEPDQQVQEVIKLIFHQFSLLKNARAVLRYFFQHQLMMPRLIQQGPDYGRIVWQKPAYQMISHILTNPVYAGVFVYGRRKNQTVPGNPPLTQTHRLSIDEWEIVVPNTYPAYISHDQYLTNRKLLLNNLYNFKKSRRGAAREGIALLQGIILCGRCSRPMVVGQGSKYQAYICRRAQMLYAESQCQAFPVRYLDQAISEIFLEALAPAQIDTILAALSIMEQDKQALERQWQLRLERAKYNIQLAQRQYDAVDPDNRLVARELEKRWNDALEAFNNLAQEYALVKRNELAPLNEIDKEAVRQLANDLPALWHASTTATVDQKRLLRLVIQEVTLTACSETRNAEGIILWSGGAITKHEITRPHIGWHCVTNPALVNRIRKLARELPDHQIAELLNSEGVLTRRGKEWTYQRVFSVRKQYGISTSCAIKPGQMVTRGDGLMSATTAARVLNVSSSLINLWIRAGVLKFDQRVPNSKVWVRVTQGDIARLNGRANCQHLPTINEIMQAQTLSRDEVWALVRAGHYLAYRLAIGKGWEWRLEKVEQKD